MGKRKKAAKPPTGPKKREGLQTVFQCLFCNQEASVTVKIEKKIGIGQLNCKNCGQSFQTTTNYLSAPVDVYYDWVDACDAVMKDNPDSNNPLSASRAPDRAGPAASRPSAGVTAGDNEEGNLDDFIEDDEMDAEADFAEV
jgi:transcription elongation factor Elf1